MRLNVPIRFQQQQQQPPACVGGGRVSRSVSRPEDHGKTMLSLVCLPPCQEKCRVEASGTHIPIPLELPFCMFQ